MPLFRYTAGAILYGSDVQVNASAGKQHGHYLIEMNVGLVKKMYGHFYDHNKAFKVDSYLSETYNQLVPEDTPPDFLMYQISIQFTFYHELAHLVQDSKLLSFRLTENLISADNEFELLDHLTEFDSDLHATNLICFHIIEFWRKLKPELINSGSISKLLSLYAATIFSYFTFLEGNGYDLYFAEYSHPHPIIRISYILDAMVAIAELNLKGEKIDQRAILEEAFNILERMAEANKQANPVARFKNIFGIKHQEIAGYVDHLITASEKIPFLVKNRFDATGKPINAS